MEPSQGPNPLKDYELHKIQPADKKKTTIPNQQALELFVKTTMMQELLNTMKTMTHLFSKKH
ncbi:MAG: hypothetical protein JSR80_03000 [Verrucomicrobia bacterium]|nr:hypothetical protein [Verrucomicrobiota bacterium]